jgi:hypothetical protein
MAIERRTIGRSGALACAAGLAAGLAAPARAADLPNRRSGLAAFVKVCAVDGTAGFTIPGADACLKISGFVDAQAEAGGARRGYYWASPAAQGAALRTSAANLDPSFGWTLRTEVDVDARQDTAWGVLRGYAAIRFEDGNGFDTDGNSAYVDLAYIQWAGLTAGKAVSFFSFFAGGEGFANFFSPDQQGANEPDLIAYTRRFDGGFSATIAAQSAGPNGFSGPGTNLVVDDYTPYGAPIGAANAAFEGMRAPDFVANLRLDEDWGAAQLAGVAHPVRVVDAAGDAFATWGWGALAGATINLPKLGDADKASFDAVFTRTAIWYSGVNDGLWNENGAANGNGLAMSVGDAFAAGGGRWASPTAWSVAALYERHFSPTFSVDPELSYLELRWSGSQGQLSSDAKSVIGGAVAHWDPAPLLDFALELLAQHTRQSTPALWAATPGTIDGKPAAFPGTAAGVAGRVYVTRSF